MDPIKTPLLPEEPIEQPIENPLAGLNVEQSKAKLKELIAGGATLGEVLAIAREDGRASMTAWADQIEMAAAAVMNAAPVTHVAGVTGEGDLPAFDVDRHPTDPKAPCFRFFAHQGCPASFMVESDRYDMVADANGQRIQKYVPGARIIAGKFGGDKRVRVIEVKTLSCCRRAEFRITPEKISELILASPWRDKDAWFELKSGGRIRVPQIQTEAEYEELRIDEASHGEAKKAQDRAFEHKMLAKRGKRGAAA